MSRVGGEVTQGANEPAGVAGSGRRASLDLDSHNSSLAGQDLKCRGQSRGCGVVKARAMFIWRRAEGPT